MLIWLAFLVLAVSVALTSMLGGGGTGDFNTKALNTTQKLEKVEQAVTSFMEKNGRRPCPADGSWDVNSDEFRDRGGQPGFLHRRHARRRFRRGRTDHDRQHHRRQHGHHRTSSPPPAARRDGRFGQRYIGGRFDRQRQQRDAGDAHHSGHRHRPAAFRSPSAGSVVGGVIPTKSLGLADNYAFDDWGRRITYVVDTRATQNITCVDLETPNLQYPYSGLGGIAIENTTGGTVLDNVMAAYISHGPDGHGAFPAQGSTVAGRINTGSTDTDELTNAGVNSSFTYNT